MSTGQFLFCKPSLATSARRTAIIDGILKGAFIVSSFSSGSATSITFEMLLRMFYTKKEGFRIGEALLYHSLLFHRQF